MNVYLRHARDDEAMLLASVKNTEELNDLIRDMRERGIFAFGDTYNDIHSQYKIGVQGAFVELIVGT